MNQPGYLKIGGGLAMLLALAACGLGGLPPTPTLTPEMPGFTPTLAELAPTLETTPLAAPTDSLAPTPLPPPTQILPPTAAPTNATQQLTPGAAPTGPGITLNPALGEPKDTVIVNGTGWPAGAEIILHWGPPTGPTGPDYTTVKADANGSFNVGLIVPPVEDWPGGAPKERDLFQLRATSPETDPFYYWANFTYIKRFQPVTAAPTSATTSTDTPTPTATPTP
jgi:hypothetical protein